MESGTILFFRFFGNALTLVPQPSKLFRPYSLSRAAMTEGNIGNILEGILAAFDAGLWFGISIESAQNHFDLGLDLG